MTEASNDLSSILQRIDTLEKTDKQTEIEIRELKSTQQQDVSAINSIGQSLKSINTEISSNKERVSTVNKSLKDFIETNEEAIEKYQSDI